MKIKTMFSMLALVLIAGTLQAKVDFNWQGLVANEMQKRGSSNTEQALVSGLIAPKEERMSTQEVLDTALSSHSTGAQQQVDPTDWQNFDWSQLSQ